MERARGGRGRDNWGSSITTSIYSGLSNNCNTGDSPPCTSCWTPVDLKESDINLLSFSSPETLDGGPEQGTNSRMLKETRHLYFKTTSLAYPFTQPAGSRGKHLSRVHTVLFISIAIEN